MLDEFGLSTKKSLGQNFLVNDDVIGKIIELSQVTPNDHVLEVGPGIGTLTVALLERAGHATSIERDARLPEVLAKTTREWADKFTLIQRDALEIANTDFENDSALELVTNNLANERAPEFATSSFAHGSAPVASDLTDESESGIAHGLATSDFAITNKRNDTLAHEASGLTGKRKPYPTLPTKFIANLPYAVAATLILDYFQKFPSIQSATVMVQREVAQRIAAKPGNKNYGAYTVKLGMYAHVTGKFAVAPNNFYPPPHVDSAVVRLERNAPVAHDNDGSKHSKRNTNNERVGARLPTPEKNSPTRALTPDEIQLVCMMADAAFYNRRKTIANSMRAYFSNTNKRSNDSKDARTGDRAVAKINSNTGKSANANVQSHKNLFKRALEPDVLSHLLKDANIDPKRRGETLSQQEFIALARAFVTLA